MAFVKRPFRNQTQHCTREPTRKQSRQDNGQARGVPHLDFSLALLSNDAECSWTTQDIEPWFARQTGRSQRRCLARAEPMPPKRARLLEPPRCSEFMVYDESRVSPVLIVSEKRGTNRSPATFFAHPVHSYHQTHSDEILCSFAPFPFPLGLFRALCHGRPGFVLPDSSLRQ